MSSFRPCPQGGNNCQLTFNPLYNPCPFVTTPQSSDSWVLTDNVLTGNVNSLTFISGNNAITTNQTDGITFLTNEYKLEILSAENNNQYIGVTVSLDGITIGQNGQISIYVPPVN